MRYQQPILQFRNGSYLDSRVIFKELVKLFRVLVVKILFEKLRYLKLFMFFSFKL